LYHNTRQKFNLYQPLSNLATYQTETYYCGIKVFNKNAYIKILSHNQSEKVSLFKFILHISWIF